MHAERRREKNSHGKLSKVQQEGGAKTGLDSKCSRRKEFSEIPYVHELNCEESFSKNFLDNLTRPTRILGFFTRLQRAKCLLFTC